jgi:hypothetical protein
VGWNEIVSRVEINKLLAKRDDLKDAIVRLSLSQRGITPTGGESRKSFKMADPEPLDNGNDPKFEQWLSRMRNN